LPADFPFVVAPIWKPIFSQRIKGIPFIDSEDMALIQFSDDIEEIANKFYQAYQKWKFNKNG